MNPTTTSLYLKDIDTGKMRYTLHKSENGWYYLNVVLKNRIPAYVVTNKPYAGKREVLRNFWNEFKTQEEIR